MPLKNWLSYLLLFLLLIPTCPAAPRQQISFSSLTTDDGLSQISVNDIYIDEFGAIWIGTREGLNRYDGNGIDTYKLEKGNPASLFCNTILRITGNHDGTLWLLCNDGISELDLRTMSFRTVDPVPAQSICYANGVLYVARGRQILSWSPEDGSSSTLVESPGGTEISYLIADETSVIWGTSEDGFFSCDLEGHSVKHLYGPCSATRIYKDSSGTIWAGTWSDGLVIINGNGGTRVLRHDPSGGESISSDFVRCCCEDNLGNIWIGTFKGLDMYDPRTGSIVNHRADDESSFGLTHSSVWCIRKDDQGTMWLGTYFGGVNWFNPEYEVYTRFGMSREEGAGLSFPVVGRMVEDTRHNLWIATEGGGVNYYDRSSGSFRWYTKDASGLSENNIKSIYYDTDGEVLWIGTHIGGLNRLDIRSGRVRVYRASESDMASIPSDIIRDILPWKDSLILATQNGVCMFDRRTGRCRRMFSDDPEGRKITMVADIHVDTNGSLWIAATGEGLYRYRFDDGTLKHYRHSASDTTSISNNNINSIMQDRNGNLWVCTSGTGLDLYVSADDSFKNFDSKTAGLLSDCIYQACESPSTGKMLLISGDGFSVFDPATRTCANYNAENGFPLSSVNENALCLTSEGYVFLGGSKGMVSFRLGSQEFARKPYRITMTSLLVDGRKVMPGDGSGILESTLPYTSSLTLGSRVSTFSIEFSTSNHIDANRDGFVYRMEGLSSEWQSCRGNNTVSYSKLMPGSYTLTVKPDGPSEQICPPAVLRIKVLSPWYSSWWAVLLYAACTTLLLVYLIRAYNTRERLKESLRYEKRRSEDIENLNQAKLRFFTNISHEIRTPLTVMVAQAESLMQNPRTTPSDYSKVLSIYKSSSQLNELISELLEFRKQEQGELALKVSPGNLVKLASEFHLIFEDYARSRGIELGLVKETERLEVWYDGKQLQKVFRNLLSNALKFTPKGGRITIFVGQSDNNAVIRISDTGRGVAPEDLENIFKRFYSVGEDSHDFNEGTGIGLALAKGIVEAHHGTISVDSEVGRGTDFTVLLPLGYNHFTPEQLAPIAAAENENTGDRTAGGETPSSGRTILVVDDNGSVRKLLHDLFSPYYKVIVASDGLEGWEKARSCMPDIIVTDVLMPGMSGTEFCRKVKSDIVTCHIPVVLLTAQVAVEQNIEGLLTGADDYIAKPFNSRLLLSRCNNLINSRILLQEKFTHQPQLSTKMLATNEMDKHFIDKATALINEHLDDSGFDIAFFAREMAMSRTNLFAKMKSVTGQTPNEFVVTMRLKRGAWLLKNRPDLSMTQIAEMTGFNSSKYFSKCFFDMYHIRPVSYRRGETAKE